MSIYLKLFLVFLEIGAVSFGGGYGMIALMQEKTLANGWLTDLIEILPGVKYGYTEGDHGYHPDKGPRPPFIAFGPDINKGIILESAELVDGAPTYAKILGIEMPDVDGRVLSELIKGE